jgi:hypothetical protein
MVSATAKSSSRVRQTAPNRTPANRAPEITLRDVSAPLGARRGVRKHASDWSSGLERRRAGAYLPV